MIVPISQEIRVVNDTIKYYVSSKYPEVSSFISDIMYLDFSTAIIKALHDAKIIPDTPPPKSG